jgi:hypothetical protein
MDLKSERSSISFNFHSTLLPFAYKSVHLLHVGNELIEMVRVSGIGVGYSKSSFEDVVDLCFPRLVSTIERQSCHSWGVANGEWGSQ